MGKKIGITMRCETFFDGKEVRDEISQDWATILKSEFPELSWIPIPNLGKSVISYIEANQLDGLILSGGNDIGTYPLRDETELLLLQYFMNKKLNILGICRGMQMIHHFFGGTLSKCDSNIHVAKLHDINYISNTRFPMEIKHLQKVNSFHHFSIKKEKLLPEFEIFTISEIDQTIEGFFHREENISGIMWHPEREPKLSKFSQSILKKGLGLN